MIQQCSETFENCPSGSSLCLGSAMYAQFRSQFPMGSLLSELLQIHEGKYIVRASIQVGGSTLATGLSAAHTIEQAEDQARSRALVILGIEVSPPHSAQNHLGQNHLGQPYPTQVHFMHSETEELPQRASQARLSPPANQADFLPMGEAAFQRALEVDWNPADSPALGFPTPEQQLSWLNVDNNPDLSTQSSPSVPRPRAGSQPTAKRQRSLQSSPQEIPRSEAAPEQHLASPIDLSEVIAQTDVELKRLGWTHVQGRRYLEKTYSKRSRQHLTDAELIEFLDYLTAQPANGKPAL
jgi:hypothetical protein